MIPSGAQPFSGEHRFGALRTGLGVLSVQGSERFAGCGRFDARPPNFVGYDVRRPLVRRVAPFVPGHRIVLES